MSESTRLDTEAIERLLEQATPPSLRPISLSVESYYEPGEFGCYLKAITELAQAVPGLLSELRRLQDENERQQDQIRELKRQLTFQRENNERRNRELDALHYVWCNGGCIGGVHRWSDRGEGITQEIVDVAEQNTLRLKQWWGNRQNRLKRAVLSGGSEPPERTD